MLIGRVKCLLVAAFSVLALGFSTSLLAQEGHATHGEPEHVEKLDAAKVIMEHIMDNHEYHFADFNGHAISIPLPVILYSPQRGMDVFMSSKLEHGHAIYNGYKLEEGKIVPVNANGTVDEGVKVYDFSLTRFVVQLFLSAILLIVIMTNVAKAYQKRGNKAPTGFQNGIEPVITFIRDEVGKPNLGHKYQKYMPYLLTVFFFILINNLLGLIPGSANVTGNISFTLVLAFISMIVILLSTNSHFWGHIFWPPGVPFLVKLILIPVEFAGVFIKPIALMIRLFANMVAGHIVIICFISLIFIFGAMNTVAGIGFSPVSLAFTVFIYLIEILVAFIQAFIFANLTAVFIGQAFETGHDKAHPHDPHPTHNRDEKEFAL
ncbi:MAG TPA: F0F1 ATP synthase subunit A [Flavisolibacter sp.]|nr:F0F1 ATP synthase subunit A [Flavisolibacter sp.]